MSDEVEQPDMPTDLTEDEAELLVSGRLDDESPVSALFAALRQPAEPRELAGGERVVAAFLAALQTAADDHAVPALTALPGGRLAARRSFRAARVAAITSVALLSVGGVAAAGGYLPDAIQRTVADAASVVGVHLPTPAQHGGSPTATTAAPAPTTTMADAAPDSTAAAGTTIAAGTGVSTAAAATSSDAPATPVAAGNPSDPSCGRYRASLRPGGPTLDPATAQALNQVAAAAGITVEALCSTPATPSPSSPGQTGTTPANTAPGQTGNAPSVTAPGQTGDTPSVTAPGQTGNAPSVTAPGQSGQSPNTTAPGQTGSNPGNTAPGQSGNGNPSATAPGNAGGHDKG